MVHNTLLQRHLMQLLLKIHAQVHFASKYQKYNHYQNKIQRDHKSNFPFSKHLIHCNKDYKLFIWFEKCLSYLNEKVIIGNKIAVWLIICLSNFWEVSKIHCYTFLDANLKWHLSIFKPLSLLSTSHLIFKYRKLSYFYHTNCHLVDPW